MGAARLGSRRAINRSTSGRFLRWAGRLESFSRGAAELGWSSDGTRLAYHPPAPGDPIFVTEPGEHVGRQIYVAPPGTHCHFPTWSPDDAFIYFVRGEPPDVMDIWRVRPDGTDAERMTFHDSRVSHPTFVDPRTLLYPTVADGSGPWLHLIDIRRRESRRLVIAPSATRRSRRARTASGCSSRLRNPTRASGACQSPKASLTSPGSPGQPVDHQRPLAAVRSGLRAVCVLETRAGRNLETGRRDGDRAMEHASAAYRRWSRNLPRLAAGCLYGGTGWPGKAARHDGGRDRRAHLGRVVGSAWHACLVTRRSDDRGGGLQWRGATDLHGSVGRRVTGGDGR